MKAFKLLALTSCVLLAAGNGVAQQNYSKSEGLLQYVDPYIGSGYHGHVFVGTSVPYGMVQLGPTNIHKGWDWCSGYHYSDSILIGFSHTHLSGTGCTDLCDILIMPLNEIRTPRGNQDDIRDGYASRYSHANEIARPEYYSLLLDRYNIKAELTATDRVGFHRYTYPEGKPASILIDLREGNGSNAYDSYIRKVDDYTVEFKLKNPQSTFIEKLAPSRKFNLVDRNNLDDYAAEMSIIEGDMTLPENKVKLKNLAAADYILVGTVDNFTASTRKNFVALTGETNYSSSSKLKISYRILEAATMEIVSVGSTEKTFSKDGAFSSCSNVEQLLFERAIGEAAEKILTDIFPDYQPKPKVEKKKPTRKVSPTPAPDYSLPL